MAIGARLRHTITIHRWTVGATTDSRGHRNDTWEPDPTTVRGWIQPRTSREIEVDEHDGVAVSDALGFLPIDVVVTDRDRLAEGDRLFEVIGPPRDAAGRGKHLEIDLRLVVT